MDYKFEIGDAVYIRPNFIELWEENRQRLPLNNVIKHITEDMIGKPFKVLDRNCWFGDIMYNIDGFGFEEYLLCYEV